MTDLVPDSASSTATDFLSAKGPAAHSGRSGSEKLWAGIWPGLLRKGAEGRQQSPVRHSGRALTISVTSTRWFSGALLAFPYSRANPGHPANPGLTQTQKAGPRPSH